jgi:Flp pilus assembly protein TadG
VEFALVLPILLIVLGGAIDLGRLFQAYVTVENAAKEGAFFGSRSPLCDVAKTGCADPNTVDWHVRSEAGSTPIGTLIVQCLAGGPTGAVKALTDCVDNDGLEVTVTTRFQLLTPLLSPILGSQLVLTSRATSVVLNEAFDPLATPFPMPTPTPTPAGATPTPTPTATPTPTPTPTPVCQVVPDLAGLTVSAARAQWNSLFSGGFTPSNGLTNKTVTGQTTVPASAPGNCIVSSASVTVTYQ